ncbi:transposase [Clostridium senegalense]|uniref:transposase n=1 Tax=Clostridium senegalense TaxID=1465809 RepID=UPI001C0FC33D|nr:transposase [Clostridium senegalense]
MPTQPRKKEKYAIYHIIIKSVKDRLLFKSDVDKATFMIKLKESQTKYPFKLYAYCLMDNHAHLLIDCQDQDISVIMKSLNLRYVKFYNKKYELDSRLCKGRFKSEIIDNDRYLLAVSLYIHRNAKDLPGFRECPQEYLFSSMSTYLGEEDLFGVLDEERILKFLDKNKKKARKEYAQLFEYTMEEHVDNLKKVNLKIKSKKEKYINERGILKLDYKIEDVVDFVAKKENIQSNEIFIKNRSYNQNARAMVTLLATAFCGEKCKDIAINLGSLSVSRISQLGNRAIKLVINNSHYKMIFENFIS